MKLVYTDIAVEDLVKLREFIEVHNPEAVRRISSGLIEGITILIEHPKIGYPVAKAPDPKIIRDIIIGDYIVRYMLIKNVIGILRIWHHREDRENNS